MKINWGTGIVIGMSLFVSFILYLVINMLTDDKFNHDLVTEEYYKKELLYQQEIDAETRGRKLSENISDHRTKNGWLIEFPENIDPAQISGTLRFYRPSSEKLDFDMPLNLKDNQIFISEEQLVKGRWNIYVDWAYGGETYLYKNEIIF